MKHEVEELEIDVEAISEEEIRKAIKNLKNGKAAGNDGIRAELIKYGGETVVRELTKLCNSIWTAGRVPEEWKEGIIIPIPKKGDLRDCNNWRGITLLSIPGKVMATVMLNRMRSAIDERLRQEQAGFRPGRSCCEQIFTLRQIIEKSLMYEKPVLINFIDFKRPLIACTENRYGR